MALHYIFFNILKLNVYLIRFYKAMGEIVFSEVRNTI